MRKKIGIVLHPYGEDKPAGLGRAIYEITKNLIELDKENDYLVILRKKPKTLPIFSGNNWKIKISDHKYFWLDFALWGESLDVCIFNTPIISFLVRPRKSVVITYDYAYEDFGGNRLVKLYNKFSLKAADLIISISEATKRETVKLFGIPEDKIRVVYLGFENICLYSPEKPSDIPQKFFFFVGAIKKRKNVLGIIKGFHEAKKIGMEHKLIIAGNGKGEYFESVRKYVEDNNLNNDVIFYGHISDNVLSYLYTNATAIIYPSFIEGFGFPVLEAMACGLPVITSKTSSLPEVAGDAAILVDPNDISEIGKAMLKITDPSIRGALVKKGFVHMKKFDWKHFATEFLKHINNINR